MNSTEALREIAEKHKFGYQEYVDHVVSDLTALISENYYPKEFIVWKEGRCKTSNREGKYLYWEEHYTLDELYNYWTNNIKQ